MKKKDALKLLNILRAVSILFFIGMFVIGLLKFRHMSVEDVLAYAPGNLVLTALFLLLLYGLKSLTVVFPLPVLYMSTGLLLPLPWAIAVSTLGIAVTVSIPYFFGRFTGSDLLEKLVEKYPKAQQMYRLKNNNEFYFVYLVKLIGIVPCDISSMILGVMRVKYRNMALGSVTGMVPYMVAVTVLGAKITEPFSLPSLISFGVVIVLTALSALLYRIVVQKRGQRG